MHSASILFFALTLVVANAHACWSPKERGEIEGFAEMDGKLILSFKDAVDCEPLVDAQVIVGELGFRTDDRGYVELPVEPFAAQMDATLPVLVSHRGYITLKTDLVIAAGTVLNRRMVLSRELPPGKMRFVLSWGDEPRDLDLHLKGPDFHISYRNMKSSAGNAELDRDALHGYGPETITLHRYRANARYSVWVDNYSNEADFTGGEIFTVYRGDRQMHQVRLKQGDHRALLLMKLSTSGNEIINEPSERP